MNDRQVLKILSIFVLALLVSCKNDSSTSKEFSSDWHEDATLTQHFAGPDFWLNPLQAWERKGGALNVIASGGDRNCVLLSKAIEGTTGTFTSKISFSINAPESIDKDLQRHSWIGLQMGLQGQFGDYRDDAIHGRGLSLGISHGGDLFIGSLDTSKLTSDQIISAGTLEVAVEAIADSLASLTLTFTDEQGTEQSMSGGVDISWLQGLIALTSSTSLPGDLDYKKPRPAFGEVPNLPKRLQGDFQVAFSNWDLSGDLMSAYPERQYGPILWTQYTLSEDILKMSAQFMPIGNDINQAELWIDQKQMASAYIDPTGANALFRLENWESEEDHAFEIRYTNKAGELFTYAGTIVANKVGKELKAASLSCVDDVGFPHQDLVDHVTNHNPDLLVFHGDQLYERVGGYGVERKSKIDYLRKWYVFGWSFRDLLKNRPSVIIPDDHDVFHGNLWGEGGKLANIDLGYGYASQDDGGYKERPDFVNMVHRTQTGHLPDPHDAKPVLNDISVYYTHLNYRGVSFAIVGDRQWKSAPKALFPEAEIENGWPQNTSWNPKTEAFHPAAQLLGARQEDFLEEWVEDWPTNVYLKALISQSPFCNVATLPADIWHDKYVPGLPKYKQGEYPEDDRPVADFDSNGWPQNKRNKAIRTIRKAFALHFTGDQHLGSTGRYGVDEYDDGGFWISSPAVSNLWPRRWYPAAAGLDGPINDGPRFTGKYEDGFGNKISVHAIANPYDIEREPSRIFDKAPGYSIITMNIPERSMNLAVWPRWASPTETEDNQPYPGWPIEINQTDNYGRTPVGYLAELKVNGEELIKVINESTEELVYALRPKSGTFRPFIFDKNVTYTVERFGPGGNPVTLVQQEVEE